MSEFKVEVVKIRKIEKHPNADTLSITNIHGGYPVVFRTEDFNEGDLDAWTSGSSQNIYRSLERGASSVGRGNISYSWS